MSYEWLRQGNAWRRVRAAFVEANPMCGRCHYAAVDVVDHVVPAEEAIRQARASGLYSYDKHAGYYLTSNLVGLCRLCYRAKVVEDKAHFGPWPDVLKGERGGRGIASPTDRRFIRRRPK